MLMGGENINKWLCTESKGSKGDRCLKTLIQRGILDLARRPVGRDRLLSSPTSAPGASWLLHWWYGRLHLAPFQTSWMSVIREMQKGGDRRLGWSHRKSVDQICMWLKAGRESGDAGWCKILKDPGSLQQWMEINWVTFNRGESRSSIEIKRWIKHCDRDDKDRR